MYIFSQFRSSAREMKNLRSVILAALLLAIHTILSVLTSIQVTESLKISISFIANALTGCLFGPTVALINGALGDLLQFMIKPTGGFFFGWTLNAALASMIYGMFFYGKLPRRAAAMEETDGRKPFLMRFLGLDLKFFLRTLIAITLVNLLVNSLLGTYWCMLLYGKHFMVYFTPRFIKNLVQIPINTLMTYYALRALAEVPDFRRLVLKQTSRK